MWPLGSAPVRGGARRHDPVPPSLPWVLLRARCRPHPHSHQCCCCCCCCGRSPPTAGGAACCCAVGGPAPPPRKRALPHRWVSAAAGGTGRRAPQQTLPAPVLAPRSWRLSLSLSLLVSVPLCFLFPSSACVLLQPQWVSALVESAPLEGVCRSECQDGGHSVRTRQYVCVFVCVFA